MALIWADGFDQYGTTGNAVTDRANVASFGYSAANNFTVGSNVANARTGAGYLQMQNTNTQNLRRSYSALANINGIGVGFNLQNIGVNNVNNPGIIFATNANVTQIKVVPQLDLSLGVYNSANVLIGSTPANIITLGVYSWVETKVICNQGGVVNTGSVEIRVNGNTQVIINGINLPTDIGSAALGTLGTTTLCVVRYDDLVIWDGTTLINNDFLGDRRCLTSFTSADEPLANWVPSTGVNGWSILDNVPVSDATFCTANVAGAISEFQKSPISINTNDIAAVIPFGRFAKSDAGISTVRVGINSNGTVLNSPSFAPGVTPTFGYTNEIVERDPDGNIPWTKTKVDNALIRMTRDT